VVKFNQIKEMIKSYFNLLVKLGSNPCTNWNRIHPDLPPSLVGQFLT
jgi:hypothetical protein